MPAAHQRHDRQRAICNSQAVKGSSLPCWRCVYLPPAQQRCNGAGQVADGSTLRAVGRRRAAGAACRPPSASAGGQSLATDHAMAVHDTDAAGSARGLRARSSKPWASPPHPAAPAPSIVTHHQAGKSNASCAGFSWERLPSRIASWHRCRASGPHWSLSAHRGAATGSALAPPPAGLPARVGWANTKARGDEIRSGTQDDRPAARVPPFHRRGDAAPAATAACPHKSILLNSRPSTRPAPYQRCR